MRCSKCGAELMDGARFCHVCTAPVGAVRPHTDTANEQYSTPRHARYDETQPIGAEPYAPPYPGRYESASPAPRRSRAEDEYRGAPRRYASENDRRSAPSRSRSSKPPKKKHTALIISIIALILVIAIVAGIIFFVNADYVSAAELQSAKDNYLPPSQAVEIDTSLKDPSNDNIKFKYDDRDRIIACSYTVNDKKYDQEYTYNDTARSVEIETKYKNRAIYNKTIEYSRVTAPDTFEAIDGYYIRLDHDSLGGSAAETTAGNTPTAALQPTAAPTMPPTMPPTIPPTQAPVSDYREMYIHYLSQTSFDYTGGTLIYLDGDDVPELYLHRSSSDSVIYGDGILCWISGGQVCYTADKLSCWNVPATYSERTGYLHTGTISGPVSATTVYYFDGDAVSKESAFGVNMYQSPFVYTVDGQTVTEEEYNTHTAQYSGTVNIPVGSDKAGLEDYIRNFQ